MRHRHFRRLKSSRVICNKLSLRVEIRNSSLSRPSSSINQQDRRLSTSPILYRSSKNRNHKMAANLPVQSISAQTLNNYTFPRHRLRLTQRDPNKQPLVLVACGSFSPITFLVRNLLHFSRNLHKKAKADFPVIIST